MMLIENIAISYGKFLKGKSHLACSHQIFFLMAVLSEIIKVRGFDGVVQPVYFESEAVLSTLSQGLACFSTLPLLLHMCFLFASPTPPTHSFPHTHTHNIRFVLLISVLFYNDFVLCVTAHHHFYSKKNFF